ncbi:meiotic recombination protein REC8 homolog [Nelusetta ayraudi]|uniref:meiotic recombination protein REC8 homolog n=1 Tax=Nelusetta ayraudi TaxID=303726 RepID=UPI003F7266E6
MNFYPPVLGHNGTFSTVWLVATKGRKVTRREILRVGVKSTCENLIDYVLGRVLPPEAGLPRPRFSLYLSSQLQYGVVVVFHRQCALLLEDLQSFMFKMSKMGTVQMIDLAGTKRQDELA